MRRKPGFHAESGQIMGEYVAVLLAVIMAVAWAAGPARKVVTDIAQGIEQFMRFLF